MHTPLENIPVNAPLNKREKKGNFIMTHIKRKLFDQLKSKYVEINFDKETTEIFFKKKQCKLFFDNSALIKSIIRTKSINPKKISAILDKKTESMLLKYGNGKTRVISPLGSNYFLTKKQLKLL